MTITITAAGGFAVLGWLAMIGILGYIAFGFTVIGMFDDIAPAPYWVVIGLMYLVFLGIIVWTGFMLWG